MKKTCEKLLSLSPLKFEEAVQDILKIKPEPKPDKKKRGRNKSQRQRLLRRTE